MTIKLGINGFGRIGRAVLRRLIETQADDIEILAINDPAPLETMAHLLEFDSLHGRLPVEVTVEGDTLVLGSRRIRFTGATTPDALAWADIDIALECSGRFLTPEAAGLHLKNGSDRVLLSAPPKGPMTTVIYGVNDDTITSDDRIVSNTSCTTNCLVPMVKVLHDAFGVETGMATTVHCYTSTQVTHDGPHADLYRARAAGLSMIPTSTGAAQMLDVVLPELAGRITGHAIRVPTPNVSCIDLVVTLARPTDVDGLNDAFRSAAAGTYAGILATTDRKLVSMDYRQDLNSAVIACDQTRFQGQMARVLGWYDNEWAFAQRMLDVARVMGRAAGL